VFDENGLIAVLVNKGLMVVKKELMTTSETQVNTGWTPWERAWHALWHAPALERLVKPIH